MEEREKEERGKKRGQLASSSLHVPRGLSRYSFADSIFLLRSEGGHGERGSLCSIPIPSHRSTPRIRGIIVSGKKERGRKRKKERGQLDRVGQGRDDYPAVEEETSRDFNENEMVKVTGGNVEG